MLEKEEELTGGEKKETMESIATKTDDYSRILLKVGLEVHQQLATKTKLFCSCPPFSEKSLQQEEEEESLSKRFPVQIKRILRPASSELGEIDEAARFESRRKIRARYYINPNTSCLVEADEEPPHPISAEALDTALIFSLALKSKVTSEIHVMRKIVVDGSNTSGFQRTAVVSLGGQLEYGTKKSVAVQSISIEEDAARALKVKEEGGTGEEEREEEKAYALDRLGTPLVEVALAPIEGEPREVVLAASVLGRLMRSTGRTARGLGTIRQDLNISVMKGKVIEVKGVQKLEQISKVVEYEAARQKFFFDLGNLVASKIGRELQIRKDDVTDIFRESESRVMKGAFRKSPKNPLVLALIVKSFAGFIGMENEFHARLGKELGAIARSYGLGGVFHSDELPDYGITEEEVRKVRTKSRMESSDAFILIAGEANLVEKASEALTLRLLQVVEGVPAETRAATEEGETTFLRPRPGAARMYPETDIPLISVGQSHLGKLRAMLPEPWDKLVEKFSKAHDLPRQLAEPLLDSDRKKLFLQVMSSTKLPPRYVASVLLDMLQSLSRENVPVEKIDDLTLENAFLLLDSGKFAKEAMPDLIRVIAKEPSISVEEAMSKAGAGSIPRSDLERIVHDTIAENSSIVKQKGIDSYSTIMGKVMQKVRGKADGKLVNELVREFLSKYPQTASTDGIKE